MIVVSGRYPDRVPEAAQYSLEDIEQARKMAREMVYVGFVEVMIGDKPFTDTGKTQPSQKCDDPCG